MQGTSLKMNELEGAHRFVRGEEFPLARTVFPASS
jgi:hypothetical protein